MRIRQIRLILTRNRTRIPQDIAARRELILDLIVPLLAKPRILIRVATKVIIVREPRVNHERVSGPVEDELRVAHALGDAFGGVVDAAPGDGVGGGELDAVAPDARVDKVLDRGRGGGRIWPGADVPVALVGVGVGGADAGGVGGGGLDVAGLLCLFVSKNANGTCLESRREIPRLACGIG